MARRRHRRPHAPTAVAATLLGLVAVLLGGRPRPGTNTGNVVDAAAVRGRDSVRVRGGQAVLAPDDAADSAPFVAPGDGEARDTGPRFAALDALSTGLYADLARRLNVDIREAPRAALVAPPGTPSRPPVIVFSDACLVAAGDGSSDGAGGDASGDGTAGGDTGAAPPPPRNPDCVAVSTVTREALRAALAARTTSATTGGGRNAFLCEYKAATKYVHCVLQPDHAAVRDEYAALQAAAGEAAAASAARRGGAPPAPGVAIASDLSARLRAGVRDAPGRGGPCRPALDGSGGRVIPALQLALGTSSTMTVYTSCPRGSTAFAGGALVAADDMVMLQAAAARLAAKYKRATCHCRLVAPGTAAETGGGGGSGDAEFEVTRNGTAGASGPHLACKCVELVAPAATPPPLDAVTAEVGARVAALKARLFTYWQHLHDVGANVTASRAAVDAQLQALRSHNLVGPIVAGGTAGVTSAGIAVDGAVLTTAQSFDPLAAAAAAATATAAAATTAAAAAPPPPVNAGASRASGTAPTGTATAAATAATTTQQPSSTSAAALALAQHRFAVAEAATAGAPLDGGMAAPPSSEVPMPALDIFYLRLAASAMRALTPAHTSAAAAELAGATALLTAYIRVSDALNALVPPVDAAANHERIRGAPLPLLVAEHARQLAEEQARLRRDIALVAARVDGVPNTDPAVVADATAALAAGSARGFALVRRIMARTRGGGEGEGTAYHGAGGGLPASSLSVMFVTGTRAGVCGVWPRCASLLGGTALQSWLVARIDAEAGDGGVVPRGTRCADGGLAAGGNGTMVSAPVEQAGGGAGGALPAAPPPPAAAGVTVAAADGSDAELAAAAAEGAAAGAVAAADAARGEVAAAAAAEGTAALLALRGWCDSTRPAALLADVVAMIARLVHPSPTPAASPAAASASAPPPAASASPSRPAMVLTLRELHDADALLAAAAVHTGGARVKPLPSPRASPSPSTAAAAAAAPAEPRLLDTSVIYTGAPGDADRLLDAALLLEMAASPTSLLLPDGTLALPSGFSAAAGGGPLPSVEPVAAPQASTLDAATRGAMAAAAASATPRAAIDTGDDTPAPSTPSPPAPSPSPSSPPADLADLLRRVATVPDAVSLLLRVNGTLACLCLHAGVPVQTLDLAAGLRAPLLPPVSLPAVVRNFSTDAAAARAIAFGGSGGSGGNATDEAPAAVSVPPFTASRLFAHVASDILALPPVTDEAAAAFVSARLAAARTDMARRRRLLAVHLTAAASASGSSAEAELRKLDGQAAQVAAERSRVAALLSERVARLKDALRGAISTAEAAAKAAAAATAALDSARKAAAARGQEARAADLAAVRDLRALLAELGQLAAAVGASESTASVAGCQGGGGRAGAALAQAAADALSRLARAQLALQRGAEEAAEGAGAVPASAHATSVARVSVLQAAVDGEHAAFLAASLRFEMATCACVARVTGVPCATGLTNGALNGTAAGGDPAALAAAGNVTGALEAAAAGAAALAAARGALDGERQRWEEAVVRLVRPKTCAQLQALATGGADGVYTIFPPDDVALGGTRVFCDMTTDGGGWTLVGVAPGGGLAGPLGVGAGSYNPADRGTAGGLNALWVAQASREVAVSWTLAGTPSVPPPAATAGIAAYGAAVAFTIPDPAATTLAVLPPPLVQPCTSDAADYSPVTVRCLRTPAPVTSSNSTAPLPATAGACPFPPRMYTGVASLGVCMGHAYGVLLRDTLDVCDGFLPVGAGVAAGGTPGNATAGDLSAPFGVMVGTDGTPGCSGVAWRPAAPAAAVTAFIPAHMAVWMR